MRRQTNANPKPSVEWIAAPTTSAPQDLQDAKHAIQVRISAKPLRSSPIAGKNALPSLNALERWTAAIRASIILAKSLPLVRSTAITTTNALLPWMDALNV